MRVLSFLMVIAFLFASVESEGRKRRKRRRKPPETYSQPAVSDPEPYPLEIDQRHSDLNSPWDVTGNLGWFNPGIGFGALGAYRVVNNIIRNFDDTLSVEAGLNIVSVSETLGGVTTDYTALEIPVMGRWDMRLKRTKFTVAPLAGFSIVTGGTQTVNGVNYDTRGGLYIRIGAAGFYEIDSKWLARAQLTFGSYSALTFGVTYRL